MKLVHAFLLTPALVILASTLNAQTKCPTSQVDTTLPAPTITAVDMGASKVSVKMSAGTDGKIPAGTVQLCVDSIEQGAATPVGGGGTADIGSISAKVGQTITAKFLPPLVGGGVQSYSLPSAAWLAGSCSKDVSGAAPLKAPILTVALDENSMASYSGSVPGASSGSVRVCVKDLPQSTLTVAIGPDGSFKSSTTFKVSSGDQITAQAFTSAPSQYGPVSNPASIIAGQLQVAGGTKGT